jgi:citronellol/citronellal dehydrogenase
VAANCYRYAAIQNLLGGEEAIARCRHPQIMADAAHEIVTRDSRQCTGNFFLDEEILASAGVMDFDEYAVTPGAELQPDFLV